MPDPNDPSSYYQEGTAPSNMNELTQKIIESQEALVEGQRHAGYQVWNKDGIATARIAQQSTEIVSAIQGIAPTLIKEDDKDDAEDDSDEETERKRREEQEEEDRRKKGEGGLFSGIMGVLKTLAVGKDGKGEKSLFGKGGIWGIVKSMFGILWKLVKFIGGPLLLIGGLAFMFMDAKKQEELIKSVTEALTGAWEFIKDMGEAFKGGFLKGWSKEDGLAKSLKEFSDAWGGVFDLISETTFEGIGGRKGLKGVAEWLGEKVADFVTGLVNVGTFIAKMITDPTETMANLQVQIEDIFQSVGDTLGRVFEDIFNIENFIKMLPELFPGKDTLLAAAAEKRAKQKKEEIDEISENTRRLKDHRMKAQKDLDAERKRIEVLKKRGIEVDETKLENLALTLARANKEIVREEKNLKAAEEAQAESLKTAIDREVNIRIEALSGESIIDDQTEVDRLTEMIEGEQGKKGTFGGGDVRGNIAAFDAITDYLKSIGKYEGGGVIKGIDDKKFSTKDLTPDELSQLLYTMKVSGIDKKGDVGDFKEASTATQTKQLSYFISNAYANVKWQEEKSKRITGLEENITKTKEKFEPAVRKVVEKEILGRVRNYDQGGVVDYTGFAMVHGGDGKPEVMFDNIQMNRLEALLTLGERDRGGGGSNDFSTQNVDSRRITSTVTNIAAPQKHLFGVQEQRFGIA
jgi:hypothetical protein